VYRVILAIPQAAWQVPEGAILCDGHVDYLTDEPPPAEALYVAEMNPAGAVTVLTPAPPGFAHGHTFAGWPPA
jgi:hypothetical protein